MSSGSFKDLIYKLFVYKLYMYEEDLALNNPQWLICHKTQQDQIIYISYIYIYI